MEFTNETIDTFNLPKFEEVQFTKLHPSYWKVTLINVVVLFAILFIALGVGIYFDVNYNEEELGFSDYSYEKFGALAALFLIVLFFKRLGFNKKSFAFRTHDLLFRHGVIATNTIVIPYNRVQHVALHEGVISRIFGLAKIEIFTAGGSSSDVEIPGIEKEHAENIKQLLMGKIQKEL
ncbi:PH domain-containing protein [Flavobacterium sp. 3HN19-14]|uniref:PH domain-containing protein n=1 Tax=Flavobacterium sp. 3HN19-14 TaxID=3448133 RepID=UPI003EE3DB6C